jgi:hypothetical protein
MTNSIGDYNTTVGRDALIGLPAGVQSLHGPRYCPTTAPRRTMRLKSDCAEGTPAELRRYAAAVKSYLRPPRQRKSGDYYGEKPKLDQSIGYH